MQNEEAIVELQPTSALEFLLEPLDFASVDIDCGLWGHLVRCVVPHTLFTGRSFEVELPVAQTGGVVAWKFETLDYDIAFGVSFTPLADDDGKTESAAPRQQVQLVAILYSCVLAQASCHVLAHAPVYLTVTCLSHLRFVTGDPVGAARHVISLPRHGLLPCAVRRHRYTDLGQQLQLEPGQATRIRCRGVHASPDEGRRGGVCRHRRASG